MIECRSCGAMIRGYEYGKENEVEVVECPVCGDVYHAIVYRICESVELKALDD